MNKTAKGRNKELNESEGTREADQKWSVFVFEMANTSLLT